jgi:peptide chain release factor 3
MNLGEEAATALRGDVELVNGVYDPFDLSAYRAGTSLAPVFFGSAFNNFGVKRSAGHLRATLPRRRARANRPRRGIEPDDPGFSGFVFKIHANLDPNHRDRVAFLRICSGQFKRNTYLPPRAAEKQVRFANPTNFLAAAEDDGGGSVARGCDRPVRHRELQDRRHPHRRGQTSSSVGIPAFSPELFRELVNKDPMRSKQLEKGIRQLTEEGVAQLFTQQPGNKKIVGCVGELQFDVIRYRLEHEYGADCAFQAIAAHKACWLTGSDPAALAERFIRMKALQIVQDKDGTRCSWRLPPTCWTWNGATIPPSNST